MKKSLLISLAALAVGAVVVSLGGKKTKVTATSSDNYPYYTKS